MITSIVRVHAPGIIVLVLSQVNACHPNSHVDYQAVFSYKGIIGEEKPESSSGGLPTPSKSSDLFLEVYFSLWMEMPGGWA